MLIDTTAGRKVGMQNITRTIFRSASSHEKKAWLLETFYGLRPFFFLAIILFLAGIIAGLITPGTFDPLFERILGYARMRLAGKGFFMTFLFIFIHNCTVAFMTIILGSLFGLLPMLSSFLNGAIVGAFVHGLLRAEKLGEILLILPHGMFELPAMFIAWGVGIWWGAYLLRKNREETFESRRIRALLLFACIFPLLLCAAAIETGMISFLS